MKLVIDPDKCTGHGRCYVLEPTLFEDDEFGHGMVRGDGNIVEAQKSAALRAIAACPEAAISLEE
ncbi:MAG: ferredoxin [Acidimicrobiia bacterium]